MKATRATPSRAMWRSTLFLATIVLTACSRPQSAAQSPPCAPAAQASTDSLTRAQLVAARDAVWRAYYQGDTIALGGLLPDPMFGMGQTREDIIASAVSFAQGRTLVDIVFTCDEFYVSGNVAVVLSNYRVDHEHSGTTLVDAGRAIEVFERRDGRWINPYWHLDPR